MYGCEISLKPLRIINQTGQISGQCVDNKKEKMSYYFYNRTNIYKTGFNSKPLIKLTID